MPTLSLYTHCKIRKDCFYLVICRNDLGYKKLRNKSTFYARKMSLR